MVSLLEQYETDTQSPIGLAGDSSSDINPFRAGYIQASLNPTENEDIFKTQRVQIDIFDRQIDQFEQCSSQICMLFKPKTIRFFNLKTKTDEYIEAPDTVSKFFFDKTGKHLFVATESSEFYYFSRSSKKFRAISKLKGNKITAVGWNKHSNERTTDAILVGTKKGSVFELCVNTNNESFLNTTIDTYCKLVYSFNKDSIVTGIEIFHLNNNSIENIYDIVITTSNRLYEFIGSDATNSMSGNTLAANNALSPSPASAPIFTSIFTYYETKNLKELANYYEMPGDIGYSQLKIRDNLKTKRKTLAWMTGGGVLTYELDLLSLIKFSVFTPHNDLLKRLISESNQDIISYPQVRDDYLQDTQDLPIGISLTEFHLAIFYKSNVKIICLLNQELVLNQKFDTKSIGKILGIWFDSETNDFGCYTSRTIIKFITQKESRKIWRIYLSKNDYEMAKHYCRDNPANLNLVLTRQAEYLFNNKKYNESAIYYAQTQNSFEEICLKYLELGDMTALRKFLTYKLNSLDSDKEITQTTVVIAYIIEIFLNQLSDYIQEKLYDEHENLHKEFYKFLDNQKVKTCLKESKEAIYKIFASHGNMDDLVYFAEVMKDYPQIITHYLQEENFRKALEALSKQTNIEVFYKYSPIFFELLPKEMVDLWIKFGNHLNPAKLLPSMASCCHNEEQANEAMRFLEHCVNRFSSEDQSIHNSLLSLYLQHSPEKLLAYVKTRKDGTDIHFDKLMLARLCTERDSLCLKEACVYLYRIMGWYEEAVDLALGLNVELAREVANSVDSDDFNLASINKLSYSDELKKMLWLRIARHVIEKENDVNKAMEFLQDLNETIAIEDVLPYFPDFVTIDQFKDSIRSSLAAYTERIQSLKENIDQAASSAQLIRADIQSIRQKSITVNSSDSCAECRFRLMTRRFYVFPCNHKFHGDCLYQTSKLFLLPSKQRRIEELHKLLQDAQAAAASTNTSSITGTVPNSPLFGSMTTGVTNAVISHFNMSKASAATKNLVQPQTLSTVEVSELKTELDELLGVECPWCGERILRTIDEPFLDPLSYEETFNSWL